jgi:glycosyltransferase involved in cell wall biosynthesis
MTDNIVVSAVTPLYNEVDSLPELHQLLTQYLSGLGQYEIIFIDDGSNDGSLEVLQRLYADDPHVRAISFRKNFGKSAALSMGFQMARGKYVVTLDADLQDDPAEIPNLIRKLEEGHDLVSGWKKKRHDPPSKTIPSKFFNFVTGLVSGLRIHDFNCGLKAYRRDVVKSLPVYGELHRFLPALAHWEGFRVSEIPVKHHARKYGRTKFGPSRFLNGFLDMLSVLLLSRYVKKPMHLFGLAGIVLTFIGIMILIYLTWGWINGIPIGNRPLFFMGILLVVFGAQAFSLGLLGEMMTRQMAHRREYSLKQVLDSRRQES